MKRSLRPPSIAQRGASAWWRRLPWFLGAGARAEPDVAFPPTATLIDPAEVDEAPSPSSARLRPSLTGDRSLRRRLIALFPVLLAGLALAAVLFTLDAARTVSIGEQSRLVGEALMHSQRLARVAPAAAQGQARALAQLAESRRSLDEGLALLKAGGERRGHRIAPLPEPMIPALRSIEDVWRPTAVAAQALLAQQPALIRQATAAVTLKTELPALADRCEQVSQLLAGPGVLAAESLAAVRLFALSERMAREVLQLSSAGNAGAERALALRSDVASFGAAADGLLAQFEARRAASPRDVDVRTRLTEVQAAWARIAPAARELVEGLPALQVARASEVRLSADSEPLRAAYGDLQALLLQAQSGYSPLRMGAIAALLLAAIAAVAMGLAYHRDVNRRAREAVAQRQQAERLEREAKSTNDRNQSAILRLMNELQQVADGDLTVQATVSEDITGAIADSVNYTIEELRSLVARINATASLVNNASSKAQSVASALQTATELQSREIRQTGDDVLLMARRIDEVSQHAAQSAEVARQSLNAADQGRYAVGKAIAGMDGIRDHIQETAKRIKRLGESSQEIGEIVALISDITERTNVLALNAAIQAASAGEAGRGFTVVAEEVQRLAERSAEATRQISGLIRTIQIDTQDAVAAMERSTQGVVAGTRLSDAAGKALQEIGRVSSQLAELIEDISQTTSAQTQSATAVARNIGRILHFTEQTSRGTNQTAASILQLATLARELQHSVSRFKVSA